MGTVIEATAVIKGKDETGGAFDAVAAKVSRVARAMNSLNRDVQKQMTVAATAAANAERQITRTQRAASTIGAGAKMAIGAGAAYIGTHAIKEAAKEAVIAGADRAHEETRMRASGMTEDEVADSGKLTGDLSAKYKVLPQTGLEHMARNVRSIVGNYEEASKVLDPLAKLKVVAMGAHPKQSEELEEDFDKLTKGMEIKGVTQDMPKFIQYMQGMAKALNVFGDTLRPTDYYEMFKYGRQATTALSDQFMLETAPTFAQELGGKSTGDAMAGLHEQFVGQHMSQQAIKALLNYGLIDAKKVHKDHGQMTLDPGAFLGQDKYMPGGKFDPYKLTNDWLLPALVANGITDPEKQQEVFAQIGSRRSVRQALGILSTQQTRIQKDWALIRGAEGLEAADRFQSQDPLMAAKAVAAQKENYLANTWAPMAPAATQGMNWFSSGLSYMSGRATQDPLRSAAEQGFVASMVAALSSDAVRAGFENAGSLWRGEGASGFRFGASGIAAYLAPILDIATRRDVLSDKGRRGYRFDEDKFGRLADIDQSDNALPTPHNRDNWFGRAVWAKRDANAAERAAIEAQFDEKGYGPPGVPGRGMPASSFNVQDISRVMGFGAEPVKAVVEGNATLNTTVTVNAGEGFWAKVDQKIENAINAFRSTSAPARGTAGSTGGSSPDAAPAH